MKHVYKVTGMSCSDCQTNVEKALKNLKEVKKVSVDLQKSEATIEMTSHIPIEKLQETLLKEGLHYTIESPHKKDAKQHNESDQKGTGVYYCPMHCEGKKTYDKPGDCPVCGMGMKEVE